jgi:hypothetical protein
LGRRSVISIISSALKVASGHTLKPPVTKTVPSGSSVAE